MGNTLMRSLSVLAVAGASLALAFPAGAATGSTAQPTPQGTVNVQGRLHHVPKALADEINSQDWGGLTAGQLAQAGIRPGMQPDSAELAKADVTLEAAQKGPVARAGKYRAHTESAHGCNKRVCIYVWGKKLKVREWDSTAANGGYRCTYVAYWAAGKIIGTSRQVCGKSSFYSVWAINRSFKNKTKLCNTWVGLAGRPCETVHR